jgi:hypothetical protein
MKPALSRVDPIVIRKDTAMTTTRFEKLALGCAGGLALPIGLFILVAPTAFYAGYGIDLSPDASLLSELRAPGAGLAALGAVMLMGVFRDNWAALARAAALIVYLGFPAGRMLGLALDGLPSASVLAALGVELTVAALCLAAFRHREAQAAYPK